LKTANDIVDIAVVMLPDPFRGMGGGAEEFCGDSTVWPRLQGLDQKSNLEVVPKISHRRAQMRDNLQGELMSCLISRRFCCRRCIKNSPVLSPWEILS